jgi:mono/diheme cytochrome c family protein
MRNPMKTSLAVAFLLLGGFIGNGRVDASDAKSVESFFKAHCLRCHDDRKQSGDFRLDTLKTNFADAQMAERWAEVLLRINSGEMPPKKEPRPTATEAAAAVEWIATEIKKGETARMAARGPVTLYRLSRQEYANTVLDLLGIHFDPDRPGVFAEDPRWHGFENTGFMLRLSPAHVEKFVTAAETVAAVAVPEKPTPPKATLMPHNRLAGGSKQRILERNGKSRVLSFPGQGQPIYRELPFGTAAKVRIQLSGLKSADGKAPRLVIEPYIDRDIVAPEDKPITLELVSTARNLTIRQSGESRLNAKNPQPFADDGSPREPILLIDWIEIETPFLTKEQADQQAELVPKDGENLDDVRKSLHRFIERAWRRPVDPVETDRFMKVIALEQKAGESFRSAYRSAVAAALASKDFLYLREGSIKERRDRIDDWELASRLSYMLWGSMPDNALFEAARTGELRKPESLRKHVARMIADPKIARFNEAFPHQWLQLHKVGSFPPDRKTFPEYNANLERSMIQETTRFFAEVFHNNLPLRDFVLSDWTMVNPRLAAFYGIPHPGGSDFAKVKLRPEDHRGGLLTQASILSLTSDGTRHRPIHRGVWVAEVLYGATIPPPPPNVEPLNLLRPDAKKSTLRMELDAHATNASCAACHRKIDPLGFGFEHYDAIGRWRDVDRASSAMGVFNKKGKELVFPINAKSELADGRKFDGAEALQKLMVQDIDRIAEAFVEKLATYALRRPMTVDDAAELRRIAQACRGSDYRLKTLIETFVYSDLMQKR